MNNLFLFSSLYKNIFLIRFVLIWVFFYFVSVFLVVNVNINKINNELRSNQVNMEKEYQRFKNFTEIFRREEKEISLAFDRQFPPQKRTKMTK
jgi:predicted membrane protein